MKNIVRYAKQTDQIMFKTKFKKWTNIKKEND